MWLLYWCWLVLLVNEAWLHKSTSFHKRWEIWAHETSLRSFQKRAVLLKLIYIISFLCLCGLWILFWCCNLPSFVKWCGHASVLLIEKTYILWEINVAVILMLISFIGEWSLITQEITSDPPQVTVKLVQVRLYRVHLVTYVSL
jgi:hypothetical protein